MTPYISQLVRESQTCLGDIAGIKKRHLAKEREKKKKTRRRLGIVGYLLAKNTYELLLYLLKSGPVRFLTAENP